MRRLELWEKGVGGISLRAGKEWKFLGKRVNRVGREGGGEAKGGKGALRISLQDEGIFFGFYLVWLEVGDVEEITYVLSNFKCLILIARHVLRLLTHQSHFIVIISMLTSRNRSNNQ